MNYQLQKPKTIVAHVPPRMEILASFPIVLAAAVVVVAAFPVWTLYAFIVAARLTH